MNGPGPAAPGRIRHWLWCGLAGGAILGLIEASERAITLRPFLPGALEPFGIWVVMLAFVMLAGLVAGVIAAVAAGAARLTAVAGPAVPAVARHAVLGFAWAMAAAGWLLLALTLTTRFDRVLDRGWVVVVAAGVAGAAITPAVIALGRRWLGPRRGPARALGALLLLGVPAVYAVNVLFAPQSSVGVHVMLDTLSLFTATMAVRLLGPPPGRAPLAPALLTLAGLLVATHFVMNASPRIASLAKTRGVTSRRAIRATAWGLDADRDGLSPSWLTAGWDTAPFDPRRPAHWVRRMRPEPARDAAAPPPALDGTAPFQTPVPRILFITIDALRVDVSRGDRPTPLGRRRPPTPTLDSLASRSASFAAAYSPASGTGDTFKKLFADAAQPGLIGHGPPVGWLPERLAAAGYRVAAFVDDPSFAPAAWGWPHIERYASGDPHMADALIDSLTAGGRAFVWVHWMPLHARVLNPLSARSYFAEAQRRRYAEGLAIVEPLVDRMMARLRASGEAESTLIVVSADHGEELGGHGHFHHNLTLYEPAVRVPLWLSGPGVVPGERAQVVPQRDLYPTLIEAAGLDASASPSRSLWPALSDTTRRLPQTPIYMFLPQRGFSRRYSWVPAVRGQAALVDPVARRKVMFDLGRERVEAYDLAADPHERVNLAGTRLAWVMRMEAALDSALDVNARPPTPALTPDAAPSGAATP